eukprot:758474-Hanusia_phi.AAC.3
MEHTGLRGGGQQGAGEIRVLAGRQDQDECGRRGGGAEENPRGHDRRPTGQDRTGQYGTAQDRIGQDSTARHKGNNKKH